MVNYSPLYNKILQLEKETLKAPEKIKEITLTEAKKLASFSEKIEENLLKYKHENTLAEEKSKILEKISVDYYKLRNFVKSKLEYFEPRKVFQKIEYALISSEIDPSKIKEKAKEILKISETKK